MRQDKQQQSQTTPQQQLENEAPVEKRKTETLKAFTVPNIVSKGRLEAVTGFTF